MNDYIKITDTTGEYVNCGTGKISLENDLCSSVVYVSYKAPTAGLLYKGFKIYYECNFFFSQPQY